MRDGVVLLFYDVSVGEKEARREYRELFKGLKRDGYMQLQKSGFYKYIRNISMYCYEVERIRKMRITQGEVYCIPMSFQNFMRMEALHGQLPDMEMIRSPFWYF